MPSIQRIQSLDFIRGLALIGIFFVNLYTILLTNNTSFSHPTDHLLLSWINMLLKDKGYILFALLFGAGIAIMTQNRITRQPPQYSILTDLHRRMLILAGIGYIHYEWIWNGDILLLYGFIGWLFLFMRHWPNRTLVAISIILYSLSIYMQLDLPVFIEFLRNFTVFFNTLTFFTLGYLGISDFAITQWFQQPKRLRKYSYIFGGITAIGFLLWFAGVEESTLMVWLNFPQALFYFFLASLFCDRFPTHWLTQSISNYGKLALTHYLSQSLIGMLIIPHVLITYSILEMIGWVILIVSLQIALSNLWLRYFYYGPIEWLWRWGTNQAKPNMLRGNR